MPGLDMIAWLKLDAGLFSVTGVLLVAAASALIYWRALRPSLRSAGLLGLSLIFLFASGASFYFVLALILLVLLTHAAASPAPLPDARADSPILTWVSLLFTTLVLMYFLLAAACSCAVAGLSPLLALIWLGLLFLAAVILIACKLPTVDLIPPTDRAVWLSDGGRAVIAIGFLASAAMLVLHPAVNWNVPVESLPVLAVLGALFGLALALITLLRHSASGRARRWLGGIVAAGLLMAFVALKLKPSGLPDLVVWIGYSYFAFRMLHVLLDSFSGQVLSASPVEMLDYALFFPTLLAGPIDRIERFVKDLRRDDHEFSWLYVIQGVPRILWGAVKKFFFADLLLSKIALTGTLFPHPSMGLAWIQLYAYALLIYCDFSGYTDIAIGTGRLMGFSIPENFLSPYTKSSITAFWQSWHMTLSGWARTYMFIPLSRRLMQTPLKRAQTLIILCAHLTTMILIGLWHGISIGFVLWGLWHALGLFVHKLYTDATRGWHKSLQSRPILNRAVEWAGVALTFQFVTLGWVMFVFQNIGDIQTFVLRLIGRGV
jgi:D-alanyl-lipoteichoic acid acyltransferase DltB (MBOAT superfamily)